MTTSTIEHIEGVDSINIESIPTDKLKEMLDSVNKEIEKVNEDRRTILSELMRRGEKVLPIG